MFKLELYDRIGNKLNLGDIVKISNGKEFSFYAEVKYLENEKVITPFHTFSFHSFEKIDKVPEHAKKSTEERYNIWYTHSPEIDEKEAAERANRYLIDWRKCEHLLEKRCFRIEPLLQQPFVSGSFQDIQEIIKFLQWAFRKIDKGDTPGETVRMLLMNRAKIDNIKFDFMNTNKT